MTVEDVKRILEQENINPNHYSIGAEFRCREDSLEGLDITNDTNRVYSVSRNVVTDEFFFDTEDEACRFFLKDMAYGYERLKKYLEE